MVSAENDLRHAGTIWMLNLDEPTPVVMPHVPAEFRRVDLESMSVVAGVLGFNTASEFNRRLECGRHCYAACVEDQVAAYGWISFDHEDIGELNLRIKLLQGEAYIWDCVTLPDYRGKRLYSALLAYILGELRVQGLCRVWIGADLDNIPSQKGMARAGFHHVADLGIERVLTRRQVWVTGLPEIPESIVSEARRAFLNEGDKTWLNSVTSTTKDSS